MLRQFLIIVGCLLLTSQVFADRVCIRKSDGVPIEYQTGDAKLGALVSNAVAAGYQNSEVEEKYITKDEYLALKKEKLDDPKKEEDDKAKQTAIGKVKSKLKLTDDDIKDLKEALK